MTVIRNSNPFDNLPPGVRFLVISNGLIFLLQSLYPVFMAETFGLTPSNVIHNFYVWQILTYAFLHGNFWHLFFNMFALWMFGPHVESYWGTRTFIRYYLICVVGAAVTQMFVAPNSIVVGASGGLYGLLLAFAFLFPDTIIYLFFFFPLRAIQAVIVIAALAFISSLNAGGEKIAHLAHLGGIFTGFLYFKLPQWSSNLRHWFGSRGSRQPVKDFKVVYPDSGQSHLAREVDRILDKISAKGLGSLTEKEHEIMKRYSEKKD